MAPLFLVLLGTSTACTTSGDDYGVPIDDQDDSPIVRIEGSLDVTRVIDGDTIEIMVNGSKEFVRMKGINAPELHPDGADTPEPFAEDSREYSLAHVGAAVVLEFNSDCDDDPFADCRDIYNRLLAYVRLANQDDLGLLLLQQGLARVYRFNNGSVPSFDRQAAYLAAETQAKNAGLGIWSN